MRDPSNGGWFWNGGLVPLYGLFSQAEGVSSCQDDIYFSYM